MTQETVSIVVPTFNRASTLRRAIDSVIRQDDPFWELINVDDGSTDAAREVLRGYKDSRVGTTLEISSLAGRLRAGVE